MAGSTIDLRVASAGSRKRRSRIFVRVAIVAAAAAIAAALALLPDPAKAACNPVVIKMAGVPGTYRYFCLPHEKAGMVGMIVVKK